MINNQDLNNIKAYRLVAVMKGSVMSSTLNQFC